MKKLLLFAFTLIVFSCSKDEDQGCKCQGKYTRILFDPGIFFYSAGNDVDCDTGQPILDIQNQGQIGIDNPAIYLGCNN